MGWFDKRAKYHEVAKDSLRLGMLTDRGLFVFLPKNERYLRLVKPLQILDEQMLTKLKRFETIYSDQLSIEARYPKLPETVEAVSQLVAREDLACFELHKEVCDKMKWMVTFIVKVNENPFLPLIFFHRAFNLPETNALNTG